MRLNGPVTSVLNYSVVLKVLDCIFWVNLAFFFVTGIFLIFWPVAQRHLFDSSDLNEAQRFLFFISKLDNFESGVPNFDLIWF